MREYLNTLVIASLTFFIGNFVGQALDSVIFSASELGGCLQIRQCSNFKNKYTQVLSKDSETIQSYWLVVEN